MLKNLSKQVRDCYRRAEEAERRAAEMSDPLLRQDFLDSAARWMKLARSYEFTEQLERFTYKPTKADRYKR